MEIYMHLFLVFVLSLLGSTALMPLLIGFARRNQLFDVPNLRSSHAIQVPRIGGVVFFIAIVVFILVERNEFNTQGVASLFFGALLLFAIGLYDDLKSVKPMVKLLAQIIALMVIVGFYREGITHFHEASIFALIPAEIFQVLVLGFFLVLVNAVNLMDGIDGLAAFISINFFAVMTLLFYRSVEFEFALFGLVLIGSIIAFLFFNLSFQNKVFMGDCGSLLLGFLMSFFSLQLMQTSCYDASFHEFSSNELSFLFLTLFSLPVIDLLRVMGIRLFNGRAIFTADRNHLHHAILDRLGLSHLQTAVLLTVIHLSLVLIALFTIFGTKFQDYPVLN
jgi:UDP-GlcNAc:undecaprenyl-phosphate GlcNAc-1-phosphate transferase